MVELIMAVLLLSVVLTAGISMELGMRRIYTQTDMEAALMGEAAPIVNLVLKDINRGIGDVANLPYRYTPPGSSHEYQIRIDKNLNARADDASWIMYRWYSNNGQLRRYPDSNVNSYDVLSERVTNFSIGSPTDGVSLFVLQLRYNRSANFSYANPQVNLQTIGNYRSASAR